MSQFGGSKNPPWSSLGTASPGAHHQVLQAQPIMGLSPSAAGLYNQQMAATAGNNTLAMQAQMQANAMQAQAQAALQPQAHVMSMQQPLGAQGMAVAVTSPSSQLNVSYPTGGRQSQGNQQKQRVFMGTVTKLHDTFGFLDEDVFFQTSTVKGAMPKVGEKVLVEATYNPNMPFKWNATRVQPLPSQVSASSGNLPQQLTGGPMGINQMVQSAGMMNPPSLMGMGMHNQQQGILGNPPQSTLNSMSNRRNDNDRRRMDRNREREERERERVREQQERDNRERKRDREHRETERKEKEKEREKDRVHSPKRRSRSPRRSPKRIRKPAPRYVVQVPRFPLDVVKANVLELRKRYTNLYIPSDFFLANCSYQDAFPLGRPFNTFHPCSFHTMPKEVEPVSKNDAVLEPPDVSYLYSAKVMLLTSVSEEEFFRNCCARVEDPLDIRDNFQHPARILSLLVGSRGKNEVMATGGPWSPSLDGPDPANDKSVLIRTAIRTTKALTGIDLSACGQWYRFLEIRYHRGEQKGRLKPRVETVVIFVPDVWTLMPTKTEWEALSAAYKKKFAAKYDTSVDEKEAPPAAASQISLKQQGEKKDEKPEDDKDTPMKSEDEPDISISESENDVSMRSENDETVLDVDEEQSDEASICTNWKDLDPKTMKVQGLRQELVARGLNSKGLKSQLVARLTKAVKKEEEEETTQKEEVPAEQLDEMIVLEEGKETEEVTDPENTGEKEEVKEEAAEPAAPAEVIDPKEAEEKKKREEKEKQLLERKYTLPETPSILVHPSPSAKGGKFECTVTNLSVLLDYRPEDTKEHSFEVSLFAELFNELLQRDFGFNIYQAILKAPEKKEEKKEKKKDDKKDEKKEDKNEDKKDEKKEDKKDEKKDDKKDDKKDEEPKMKKRKVEETEEQKVEEKKEEGKEKKPETEDTKKDDKKKDEKGNKSITKNRRSVSQELAAKGKVETLHPLLLLSCVYFDQNHCGYILDKDLEDLLNCLGLHLSRAQVRKLLHKVLSRDSWHYRKVTDAVKEKEENATINMETNGPTSEDPLKGNLSLLEPSPGKSPKNKTSGEASTDMVTFQGSVVDLASIMTRLKKSEQQRNQAENKIIQLQRESDKWKNAACSSQESLKFVNIDVDNLKKKLHETEDGLRSSRRKNEDFKVCIEKAHKSIDDVSNRFKVVMEKDDRKDKEKDKEKKSVTSEKKDVKT